MINTKITEINVSLGYVKLPVPRDINISPTNLIDNYNQEVLPFHLMYNLYRSNLGPFPP